MCDSCGCDGTDGIRVSRVGASVAHHDHHDHGHGHENEEPRPGRTILVAQDILAKNREQAEANRRFFRVRGVLALNLLSSPGSGKTTLLEHTIGRLKGELALAVIEGDQQTLRDAERISATGVDVVQVNTGSGCHLDAAMIHRALHQIELPRSAVLFIENVGNLVCPAMFDLGEGHKVVIISVTEGEDKPLKYPYMFREADICVITKTDLLPHLDFDLAACRRFALEVNPHLVLFEVSAKSGAGLDQWCDWVRQASRPGS
jgi:hydrogenase nickel incorporation protein HypB